jgi:hypothetical protein
MRGTTQGLSILFAVLFLLTGFSLLGGAAVDDIGFTWGYAPNIYGSPDWDPWWQAAKDGIVGGSFVGGTGGTFAGSPFFIPVDETVYSFGDLGTRIHWIYRIPDTTIAELDGLFEVKWVVDWSGTDWTTDASGAWILDDPDEGWSEPSRWEEEDGDVFGSVGFAWWGAYGYRSDSPEARAQLEEDLQLYWDEQTYATGLIRYRSSPADPWTVEQIKLTLMPQWFYEKLVTTPVFQVAAAGPHGPLHRGPPDIAGGGGTVGELELSAIYEIGELITGCVLVADGSGDAVPHCYFPMTVYKVTIGEAFDRREPLFAETLSSWGHAGEYCFEIETDEMEPGYYDIRLGCPDGTVEWIRVQLVDAE